MEICRAYDFEFITYALMRFIMLGKWGYFHVNLNPKVDARSLESTLAKFSLWHFGSNVS